MPIDTTLLKRIEANDKTLETLDLSYKNLDNSDIENLVNALVTNTTLTNLNIRGNQISDKGANTLANNTTLTALYIGYNKISDEGAKALANNTTLTTLDISDNQIGNEGAKFLANNIALTTLYISYSQIGNEGAIALANNTTLTTLYISSNLIGDEGAIALANNTTFTTLGVRYNHIRNEGANALANNSTLTTLDVSYNQIGAEEEKLLSEVIARNKQNIIARRNQFVQILIILAYDKANENNRSLWSILPKELKLYIISLINFHPLESIGKSPKQIKSCTDFIFTNTSDLRESLAEAITTKKAFKLLEKITPGKSDFRFFPSKPYLKSSVTLTSDEESRKPLKKFQ